MKNKVTIRTAGPDDQPFVYRLICALENDTFDPEHFETIFRTNLEEDACHYYVAENGNQIIGFISLHIQQLLHHCGPVGEIQEFYIDPHYRGQGVGRAMIEEIKECARLKEVKSLEVTTNKKRTENVSVYEHLGFTLSHNKFTISYP